MYFSWYSSIELEVSVQSDHVKSGFVSIPFTCLDSAKNALELVRMVFPKEKDQLPYFNDLLLTSDETVDEFIGKLDTGILTFRNATSTHHLSVIDVQFFNRDIPWDYC